MGNVTVNISFQDTLLEEIDAEAKKESRSRSELLREAARAYVQKQQKWERLFALGDALVQQGAIAPKDVNEAIREVRRRKRDAP